MFLVPFIHFLFESLKLIRQFSSRFDQISGCSKLLKYFNKKGETLRCFLLFLIPHIRFLCESLKLIKQFSPRFDQISGCSKLLKYFNKKEQTLRCFFSCSSCSFLMWVSETNQTVVSKIRSDIWMLKIVKIFQHFSKIFTQLKIFLVPHQWFSFFYLAPKEFFFLRKTNSCSCSNWLKYYIKILTSILSAAILYHSGDVRNYFFYKAPIDLPTEDIKPFGQNVWSVPTWEPWL